MNPFKVVQFDFFVTRDPPIVDPFDIDNYLEIGWEVQKFELRAKLPPGTLFVKNLVLSSPAQRTIQLDAIHAGGVQVLRCPIDSWFFNPNATARPEIIVHCLKTDEIRILGSYLGVVPHGYALGGSFRIEATIEAQIDDSQPKPY